MNPRMLRLVCVARTFGHPFSNLGVNTVRTIQEFHAKIFVQSESGGCVFCEPRCPLPLVYETRAGGLSIVVPSVGLGAFDFDNRMNDVW
jgi:hypothetical protein